MVCCVDSFVARMSENQSQSQTTQKKGRKRFKQLFECIREQVSLLGIADLVLSTVHSAVCEVAVRIILRC